MTAIDTEDLSAQLAERAATIAPRGPSSAAIVSRARQTARHRRHTFTAIIAVATLSVVIGGLAIGGPLGNRDGTIESAGSGPSAAALPPLHMGLGASDQILFVLPTSPSGATVGTLQPAPISPLSPSSAGPRPPVVAVDPPGSSVVVSPPGGSPSLGAPLTPADLPDIGVTQSEITYQLHDETRATILVGSSGGGQRFADQLAAAKAAPTAERFTIQAQGTTALVTRTPRPGADDILVDVSWIEPGGHLVTITANSSHASATIDPASLAGRARTLSDAEYQSILDQYGH